MIGKQMLVCSAAAARTTAIAAVFLLCARCSSSGSGSGAPGAGGAADVGNTGGTANPAGNGGTPNGTSSGGSTVSGNGGTPGGTASGGTATVTGNGGSGTASGGTNTASGGAGGSAVADAGGKCPASCEFLSAECFCQPGALFAPITDWASAQKICQTVGLNLATIHNKAESDAIGAVLTGKGLSGQNSSIWIGLNDQKVQDKWEWVSGAPFSFTAWLPGQPNNSPLGGPGGEHCVVVQASGQWDDFPCGQNVGFVCN